MMKWWGWGAADRSFDLDSRPLLRPWLEKHFDFDLDTRELPVCREDFAMPVALDVSRLVNALAGVVPASRFTADEDERLLHCFGKSYPDLFRVRRGEIPRAPDVVVMPESHDEVEAIVRMAAGLDMVVIPFGGGTNIVGGVNPEAGEPRPVISLDLRAMDRLLEVDETSHTATMQAGMFGPEIEKQLNERGWSLGHYPDSFEYSTLGGWLATRSAGMQSDAFGKIEDMVMSIRMVSPSGTIETIKVPRSASGPSLNQIIVGSEGTLGVITEATMCVHPAPETKQFYGILFPRFADGVEAIRACTHAGNAPTLLRMSDEGETQFSFHLKPPPTGLKAIVSKVVKAWLARRGFVSPALMIAGFEGSRVEVARRKRASFAELKRHGGFMLGRGVGESWSAEKFNLPYIRDAVMDRGVRVDVAETATTWSNLVALHEKATRAMQDRFKADGNRSYLGCHLSHAYETGACLYFTWAAPQVAAKGAELDAYQGYKNLITEVFMSEGGTVSHHHAIGTEHRAWMRRELGDTGIQVLGALKHSLDPRRIMNPGKLLPDDLESPR